LSLPISYRAFSQGLNPQQNIRKQDFIYKLILQMFVFIIHLLSSTVQYSMEEKGDHMKIPNDKEQLLLRPDEVALRLGIGRSKVYALINSQAIPSLRIGGSIRVAVDSLKSWIKEHEQN
jgi:excisionase family DNA binding protein